MPWLRVHLTSAPPVLFAFPCREQVAASVQYLECTERQSIEELEERAWRDQTHVHMYVMLEMARRSTLQYTEAEGRRALVESKTATRCGTTCDQVLCAAAKEAACATKRGCLKASHKRAPRGILNAPSRNGYAKQPQSSALRDPV